MIINDRLTKPAEAEGASLVKRAVVWGYLQEGGVLVSRAPGLSETRKQGHPASPDAARNPLWGTSRELDEIHQNREPF